MGAIETSIDRLFAGLSRISLAGEGWTRPAFSPEEQAAHDFVASFARELGMAVETDGAGNLFMTLAGRGHGQSNLIIGSHLDTVPSGGAYDGAAGVVGGLAVAAQFVERQEVPPVPLTIMAIRAEESVWFPVSYLGSRAALGRLEADALETIRSDSGRTLADHIGKAGFDPDFIRNRFASIRPETTKAFLEIHIEQGPVLHDENLPVGLVSAIRGGLRFREASIRGSWGHSGAMPRRLRRDVGFALADFMTRVESEWDRLEGDGEDIVATFGIIATDPEQHAFSKVPGLINFSLDMRSTSPELLDVLNERLQEFARQISVARNVDIDLGPASRTLPAKMDSAVYARLATAADRLAIPTCTLPSGAGHDAAAFAQAGIPTGMIFVRNEHGSHNPAEAMAHSDLALAASLLYDAILNLSPG